MELAWLVHVLALEYCPGRSCNARGVFVQPDAPVMVQVAAACSVPGLCVRRGIY